MTAAPQSRFYSSEDGLRLHYLDFAPRLALARLPVVCLPGLTRNADDFLPLATALSGPSATPRRVIAIDYRGRGRSDHDPDWRHYNLQIERGDILRALEDAGIDRAHFVGTSRGGLHIMALASTNRDVIAAAVLNDIGPVLERDGLARIKGYVGRSATPASFDQAVALLRMSEAARDYVGLSAAEWRFYAEATFGADESALRLRYDPNLARTLEALDLSQPLAESWDLFDLLTDAPLLTVRGALSDLLSIDTFGRMVTRWPKSQGWTVAGQGHAPLLADAATIDVIDRFLAAADVSDGHDTQLRPVVD